MSPGTVTAYLAGLFTAMSFGLGPASAGGSSETRLVPVESGYFRASGPDDLVLEVQISGGFGKMLGHVFRLYGDGRLEEALLWNDDRAGAAPVRELPFSSETRDRFLESLVQSGVPGSTRESLVAELQTGDPRFRDLVWSPDCLRVHVLLWLFEKPEDRMEAVEVLTDLRLECTYKYKEIYPESKRLVTLARSIDELLALSEAAGWE